MSLYITRKSLTQASNWVANAVEYSSVNFNVLILLTGTFDFF